MIKREWETYIDPITVSGGGGNETFAYSCQYCEGYTEPEEPKDTMKHTTWCPVPTIKRLEDMLQEYADFSFQIILQEDGLIDMRNKLQSKFLEFYEEKVTND